MPGFDDLMGSVSAATAPPKPAATGGFDALMQSFEVSPEEDIRRSQAAGLSVGRTPEEHAAYLKEKGYSPEDVKRLTQQYKLGKAETDLGRFPGGKETIVGSVAQQFKEHGIPFRSLFVNPQKDQAEAQKRLEEGTATDADFKTLALAKRTAEDEQRLRQAGIGGEVLGGLRGTSALFGEFMAGGALAKTIGAATPGLAGRVLTGAAGTSVGKAPLLSAQNATWLQAFGTNAGRMAVINAMVPSTYMDVARQKNLENGREADDWRGLPPAMLHSYGQLLVLGRVFQGAATAAPGIRAGAAASLKGGATGAVESAIATSATKFADLFIPKAYKISTDEGTFEKLMTGNVSGAARKFAVDTLTFGAFAGLHRMADAGAHAVDAREQAAKAAERAVATAAEIRRTLKQTGHSADEAASRTSGILSDIASKAYGPATKPTERPKPTAAEPKGEDALAHVADDVLLGLAEFSGIKAPKGKTLTRAGAIEGLQGKGINLAAMFAKPPTVAPVEAKAAPTEAPAGPEIVATAKPGEAAVPETAAQPSEKPTGGLRFGGGEVLSASHQMNPAERHAFDKYGNAARLSVLDASGKEIGQATISESGKTLHVPWLGASGLAGGEGRGAHPFGPREVRQLARQLAEAFPDAEVMSYTPSGGRIRQGETRHVDLVTMRAKGASRGEKPVTSATPEGPKFGEPMTEAEKETGLVGGGQPVTPEQISEIAGRMAALNANRKLTIPELRAGMAELDALPKAALAEIAKQLGYPTMAKGTKAAILEGLHDNLEGIKLSQHRADRINKPREQPVEETEQFGKPMTAAEKGAGLVGGGQPSREYRSVEDAVVQVRDLMKFGRTPEGIDAFDPPYVDAIIRGLAERFSDPELKQIAKEATGTGGRGRKDSLRRIWDGLIGARRIIEGQEVPQGWGKVAKFGPTRFNESVAVEQKAQVPETAESAPAEEFGRPMTGAERRTGQQGGGQENAPEATVPGEPLREFGLKNVETERLREENRLPPIIGGEPIADAKAWAETLDTLARDPNAALNLIAELTGKMRATTEAENLLLLHRRTALDNEYRRSMGQAIEGVALRMKGEITKAEEDARFARSETLLAEIDRLDNLIVKTGTETGRSLRSRQLMAREDFSLATMMARAQNAKGETPLTREEQADIAALSKRIEELTRALDESKSETKEAEAEKSSIRVELKEKQKEFAETLDTFRWNTLTPVAKVRRVLGESLDFTRALKTAFDLSAGLRQGAVFALGHPIRFFRDVVPLGLKAFRSEREFQSQLDALMQRENWVNYERDGLPIMDAEGPITRQEEAFIGRWVDWKPPTAAARALLAGVKASGRSYSAMLNRIRADHYDLLAATLSKTGKPTLEEGAVIANAVSVFSGRANLPRSAENAATWLTKLFFAPRFVASRFQLLAGQPLWQGTSRTRGAIAREYARALAGLGVVYMLAGLDDEAKITFDPRSSDFGKIRFGDTRLDPLAGLSQAAVFVTRVVSGEKLTLKGKLVPLREANRYEAKGKIPYGSESVWDVTSRFVRTKMAPVPGAVVDAFVGSNVIGEPTTVESSAESLVAPMIVSDVYEALLDQGVPRGAAISLLAILGMGSQTYEPKPKK